MAGGQVLVLGAGMQGKAVLEDLERRCPVERVVAADIDRRALESWLAAIGAKKTAPAVLDGRDEDALRSIMSGSDVVIDMLPAALADAAARAAIEAGVHLVNTNYAHHLRRLDAKAHSRGVTVMGECGFDPGIDLVIAGRAAEVFDEIEVLMSYAGGIPAPECRDTNPLSYKISWSFAGVLASYRREGRIIDEGAVKAVAPEKIFSAGFAREVDFGEFGKLEAFVNGDAVAFVELMGARHSVKTTGRYALRWPGHSAFWSRISALGLLDDAPDPVTGESPRELLRRRLEPRLQYGPHERDMAVLRVDVAGKIGGRRAARRWEMVDYRDLETGLMAMNRTVGYPASIAAGMILEGKIARRGVCSPVRDVPAAPFFSALAARGIDVTESEIDPDEIV